jgi:hypothetical protein
MDFAWLLINWFLLSSLVGFLVPFVLSIYFQRDSWKTIGVVLISLSAIGACAGMSGGMSRAAAVGDIIPAFLGLLGGVSLYLFGVDRSKGLLASLGAAALSVSLFSGYAIGSQQRNIGDDHRELREICSSAYSNPKLVSSEAAFNRFEEKIGYLCPYAMVWHITEG